MYQVLVQDAKNRNPSIDLRSEEVISIQGVDFSLAHADLLIRLAALTRISGQEKSTLLIQAKSIIKRIVDENVVVNPRGAFIGRSESSSRLSNTLAFIDVIIRIGGPDALQYQTILDQMTRWVMSEKKLDGSWGSTADTTAVVRSITGRERMTREVAGTHLQATVSLDSTVLDRENIGKENALAVFSTGLSLDRLQDDSVLHFEKVGTGRIYYDIALQYALKASSIKPRDEGFFIESAYYDYAEYRKIEKAKEEEWHRYLDNKILYTDLQYPRDVVTYLKPLSTLKIGELIIISNRMITPEPRDQVAFEGFIPSGTELVNPNLKTESADITQSAPPRNSIFDHEEWQDDRYF